MKPRLTKRREALDQHFMTRTRCTKMLSQKQWLIIETWGQSKYCIEGNFGGCLILALLGVWVDCAKSKHYQIIFGYQQQLSQVATATRVTIAIYTQKANLHLFMTPLI